jgi:hypothetical protein
MDTAMEYLPDDMKDLDKLSAPHTATLVCLNFKVPLDVRQQFKICAARRNMTMTDLLLRLLDEEIRK